MHKINVDAPEILYLPPPGPWSFHLCCMCPGHLSSVNQVSHFASSFEISVFPKTTGSRACSSCDLPHEDPEPLTFEKQGCQISKDSADLMLQVQNPKVRIILN